MATYESVKTVTASIDGAVRAYRLLAIQADGNANEGGANADIQYISTEAVTAEQYDSGQGQTEVSAVDIGAGGKALVEAGAAIAVGANVQCGADGRAITQAGSNPEAGIALQAATAAGEIITIQLAKG